MRIEAAVGLVRVCLESDTDGVGVFFLAERPLIVGGISSKEVVVELYVKRESAGLPM